MKLREFPSSFDEHFREVQRYTHRHGWGTFYIENAAWLALFFTYAGRPMEACYLPGVGGLSTHMQLYNLEQQIGTHRALFPGMRSRVRIGAHQNNEAYQDALLANGFVVEHCLSGWVVTRELFKPRCPRPKKGAGVLEIVPVTTDAEREEFAYVADTAVAATYGTLPGEMQGLFASTHTLNNANCQGFVGRLNGRPVRTMALHLFGEVGSINYGAALPEIRGLHLGDAMIHAAIRHAFDQGIHYVAGQTMPAAVTIPARFGAQDLLRYVVWRDQEPAK